MAEGRCREAWARHSALLALIAETHRDPKQRSRPFTPAEFDPYHQARRTPPTREETRRALRGFVQP